jgi:FHS family L-fucose permease-like MFS transporter
VFTISLELNNINQKKLFMKPINRTTYAVIIIGILFFIFGFVTWLNGTLIPFLKLACQLKSDTQAFFVTFSFYMAYFFLAIPSSYVLKKTGYKNGMALGLFVMAIGSIISYRFICTGNGFGFAANRFQSIHQHYRAN